MALVHDYLTQRGGAERVVLEMVRAFPGAPLHTSLYDPRGTFPEFAEVDVRVGPLQHLPGLARHHRLGLPLYAPAASRTTVDADVVLCSSSGWAHGVRTTGRKVGYLHAPARWLHQPDRYVGAGARGAAERAALSLAGPPLRRWDRRAVASLDRVLCNSRAVAAAIEEIYGLDATVVPPPPALGPGGPEQRPLASAALGDRPFVLCVARLLPYKNVDVAVAAARRAEVALVVVGRGPDEARLRALAAEAGAPVVVCTDASDAELRWLYRHCASLVAVSIEDYGLTPLEATSFGRPTVALAAGGYLDTVEPGLNGVLVADLDVATVAAGVTEVLSRRWDPGAMAEVEARFAPARFRERLRHAVL